MTKLQFTKFGLKHNPIGAHVALTIRERRLLGEVTGVRYDETCGCFRLTVKHFNGEAWPIDPSASAVMVLERS